MAFRIDIGQLRPPKKMADGRLVAEGLLSKAGVFVYRNPDGSERRELRPPEEVFRKDTLESFSLAPVTNDHPPDLLNGYNAKQYSVGSVGENVTRDEEHVRAKLSVYDAATIAQMEAGKSQLSCGYEVDLDETPGEHPIYGRYDAVQRNIRGNHVAIVQVGRAGESARVRMDAAIKRAAQRADVAPSGWEGTVKAMKGHSEISNPYALAWWMEGEGYASHKDEELSSEQRNSLSSSSFAVPGRSALPIENAGHVRAAMARFNQTHFQSEAEKKAAYHRIVRRAKELGIDSSGFEKEYAGRMDAQGALMANEIKEGLEVVMEKLASAEKRADAAEKACDAADARTAEIRGQLETLKEECASLSAARKDAADAKSETSAWRNKYEESEAARLIAEDPKRFDEAVQARVKLERMAAAVLGAAANFEGLTDQQIHETTLDRLGVSRADYKHMAEKDQKPYLMGRFDTAVSKYLDGERALDKLRSNMSHTAPGHEIRVDARTAREKMISRNRNPEKEQA